MKNTKTTIKSHFKTVIRPAFCGIAETNPLGERKLKGISYIRMEERARALALLYEDLYDDSLSQLLKKAVEKRTQEASL